MNDSVSKECVLVIGASGFLGSKIKEYLEKIGLTVFGTYSSNCKDGLLKFSFGENLSDCQFQNNVLKKITSQGYFVKYVIIATGVTNDKSILSSSLQEYRNVLVSNLELPYYVAKIMIQYYLDNKIAGSFLFISSINSQKGFRNKGLYSISKAGVNILSETVAAEYGKYGITSNVVMPSFYMSKLNKNRRVGKKKFEINTRASLLHSLPKINEFLEFVRYLLVNGKSISGQKFIIDNRDFQQVGNSIAND